ncbi:MAG: class I SAM-dependent methyltransferase [Armatimonadetes bacterium]|nr:class I SAM-dependent methyltransferase [Armatimonadota bacterium]MDE2207366.1 class I SAM-dependent methyltransferase [Armatimonadota bacterium]
MTSEAGSAFSQIAPIYDELMRGVPYGKWYNYVLLLLQRNGRSPTSALDLACGTGTFSLLLAKSGMAVTGVDRSAGMIDEARRKASAQNLDVRYLVQEASALDVGGEPFDLCVCLFDSLNYILDDTALLQCFSRVRSSLTPRAAFIFDMNTEFALANEFFDQEVLDEEEPLRHRWLSRYDADTGLCRVEMEFWIRRQDGTDEMLHETHVQRAPSVEQVTRLLMLAGFRRVEAFNSFTLAPPGPCSDRVHYVALPA